MTVYPKELVIVVSVISLVCAAYMTALFYRSKKNPMMFYISLSVMFSNVLGMLGFRYGFDWNKAPIELCYFQALAVRTFSTLSIIATQRKYTNTNILHQKSQFMVYMISACGFIYTLQTYRLLVLRLRHELTDSLWKKFYYAFIIAYPVVGTTVVSILAFQEKAVKVREFQW